MNIEFIFSRRSWVVGASYASQGPVGHLILSPLPMLLISVSWLRRGWRSEAVRCSACQTTWVAMHERAEALNCPCCGHRTAPASAMSGQFKTT